ncbi:MAG: DUF4303 domain-containing protein [Planctomycetaceae bacterium]|nr:DUF4303 domain-containing protein [Planctomycetaceae bacterium]
MKDIFRQLARLHKQLKAAIAEASLIRADEEEESTSTEDAHAGVFTQLRHDMANAARLTFDYFQREHPTEDFYAFALYTDDDASGAIPAANSEQSFERAKQRYVASHSSPTPEKLRYTPDEWGYAGGFGAIDEWHTIWETNETIGSDDGVLRRLETMMLALKDLDAEGYFGDGPQREKITLMIWITDSYNANEWRVRSVKELNPRTVYKRFLSEFPQ